MLLARWRGEHPGQEPAPLVFLGQLGDTSSPTPGVLFHPDADKMHRTVAQIMGDHAAIQGGDEDDVKEPRSNTIRVVLIDRYLKTTGSEFAEQRVEPINRTDCEEVRHGWGRTAE